MKELICLTKKNLTGNSRKRLFWNIDLAAKSTDFAYALGSSKDAWFTCTTFVEKGKNARRNNARVFIIDKDGNVSDCSIYNPLIGMRPIIKYADIKDECVNEEDLGNCICRVEYGEYPQKRVPFEKKPEMEMALRNGDLLETGKTYTVCGRNITFYRCPNSEPELTMPYREINDGLIDLKEFVAADGKRYVRYEGDWFEVAPVKWLVDKKEGLAITEDIIGGKIPYSIDKFIIDKRESLFEKSNLDYLVKKINPSECEVDSEELYPLSVIGFMNLHLLNDLATSKQKEESLDDEAIEDIEMNGVKSSTIRFDNIDIDRLYELVINNSIVIDKADGTVEFITTVKIPGEKGPEKVYRK